MTDELRLRASEVGSAFGVGRKGAFTVWHEMAGRIPREAASEQNEAIASGRVFEEPIAKLAEQFYKLQVVEGPQELVHTKAPLIGHPDRYVLDATGMRTVLEIKLVFKGEDAEKWGPAGTDQVPKDYYLQLLTYLAIFRDWCREHGMPVPDMGYLGAWFAGIGLRLYRVPVQPKVEEALLAEVRAFVDSVRAGNPPDAASLAEMRMRWLADKTKRKLVGADTVAAVRGLRDVREQRRLLEKQEEQLAMLVLGIAGDAGRLYVQRGASEVDICSMSANRVFDQEAFAAAHPELVAKYVRLDTTALREQQKAVYEQFMREPANVAEQTRVIRPMKGLDDVPLRQPAEITGAVEPKEQP